MINIFLFEGHLGKDPELKKSNDNVPYCTFTMAQTVKRKVKGEDKEFPMWAEVTIWGKIAENHARNLHKGRRVIVNGSMFIEEWIDRDNKNRYTMKIKALEVNYADEPTRRGSDAAQDESTSGTSSNLDNFEEEKSLTAEDETPAPWK